MAGWFHALVLAAVVVLTVRQVVRAARRGDRPRGVGRFVLGVGGAFALAAVGLVLATHRCHAGAAVQSWAIPAVALLPAATRLRGRERTLFVVGLLVVGVALTSHYTALVHGGGYVGVGGWAGEPSHRGHAALHTWLTGLREL